MVPRSPWRRLRPGWSLAPPVAVPLRPCPWRSPRLWPQPSDPLATPRLPLAGSPRLPRPALHPCHVRVALQVLLVLLLLPLVLVLLPLVGLSVECHLAVLPLGQSLVESEVAPRTSADPLAAPPRTASAVEVSRLLPHQERLRLLGWVVPRTTVPELSSLHLQYRRSDLPAIRLRSCRQVAAGMWVAEASRPGSGPAVVSLVPLPGMSVLHQEERTAPEAIGQRC